MIRTVFILVLALHGLIHLMGFAKAFGYAELPQLAQLISRPVGLLWLFAALLLLATSAALPLWPRGWWLVGLFAFVASQGVIASSWGDARYGTIANIVLLAGVIYGFASRGPLSLRAAYENDTRDAQAAAASSENLAESDLAALPVPVQRYLRRTGVVGKPRVRNFRATWTGRMRATGSDPWMSFTAEQFNSLDPICRYFKMDATMGGIPVDVLHSFDKGGARFRVKLLSLIKKVDAKGAELTRTETVTLFNDLCVLAPGALVSPSISWEPIDAHAAKASFTLRNNVIRAVLRFNDLGDLIDFESEDRLAGSPDGRTFTAMGWSTPVRDYAQMGPARVSTRAEVRWHPASGAFTYGEFQLTSLAYNLPR
jgi:hypothetical protein